MATECLGNSNFANRSEFPLAHLVLLGLKLPYIQGFEVLKWIRQEAALSTPVVIPSSSENEADIETACEFRANAYLVKPSDTVQFVNIAKAINDFWLTNNWPSPKITRSRTLGNLPVSLT